MTLEVSTGLFIGFILILIGGFLSGQITKHRNTKEKFFLYYGAGVALVITIIGTLLVLTSEGVVKFV